MKTFTLTLLICSFLLLGTNAQALNTAGETGVLQYQGKPIHVSLGKIESVNKDYIAVEVLSDLEIVTEKLDAVLIFASLEEIINVKVISGGETLIAETYEVLEGGMTSQIGAENVTTTAKNTNFLLRTKVMPDQIIIYNDFDPGVVFDGQTKKVVK